MGSAPLARTAWQLLVSQPIADTLLGEQIAGLGGFCSDLATQGGHEDSRVVGLIDIVRAPDFFQDEAVSQHFAAMFCEGRQQTVFDGSQVDFFVAQKDTAGGLG